MLPFAATTVTVKRLPADATRDGYDDVPARTTAKTGLRATIGAPSGRETVVAGDRTVVTFTLNTDPFDFQPTDQIIDETTGQTYELIWSRTRTALIPHTEGRLMRASGTA